MRRALVVAILLSLQLLPVDAQSLSPSYLSQCYNNYSAGIDEIYGTDPYNNGLGASTCVKDILGISCGPQGTSWGNGCSCRCQPGYGGLLCTETSGDIGPFGFAWTALRRCEHSQHFRVDGTVRDATGVENKEMTIELWVQHFVYLSGSFDLENTYFELRSPRIIPSGIADPNIALNWYDGTVGRYSYSMVLALKDFKIYLCLEIYHQNGDVRWTCPLSTFTVRTFSNAETAHLAVTVRPVEGYKHPDSMKVQLLVNGALEEEAFFSSRYNYFDNRTMWFGPWRKELGVSRQPALVSDDTSTKFSGFRVDPGSTSALLYDEVRIWNRALPQLELIKRLNTPLVGDEPGLMAYYNFDEAVESKVINKAHAYPSPYFDGVSKAPDPLLNWGNFKQGYGYGGCNWNIPGDCGNSTSDNIYPFYNTEPLNAQMFPMFNPSFVPTIPSLPFFPGGSGFIGFAREGPAPISPTLFGHSANLVTALNKTVVIGGLTQSAAISQLLSNGITSSLSAASTNGVHLMDLNTNVWTSPTPTGSGPTGLCWHTATEVGSSLVVVGGSMTPKPAYIYDGVSNSWQAWGQNFPKALMGHSAVYHIGSGQIVIFGGGVANLGTHDLDLSATVYLLNVVARVVVTLEPRGTWPSPRAFHTAVIRQGTSKMIIHGGVGSIMNGEPQLENWQFDLDTLQWTQLQNSLPVVRMWPSYGRMGDDIIVEGGIQSLNALPLYDNSTIDTPFRDAVLYVLEVSDRIITRQLTSTVFDGAVRHIHFGHQAAGWRDKGATINIGGLGIAMRGEYVGLLTAYTGGYEPYFEDQLTYHRVGCGRGYRSESVKATTPLQICLACPGGEYQPLGYGSADSRRAMLCLSCPIGFYTDGAGALTCIRCPGNTTTTGLAGSIDDCTVPTETLSDGGIAGVVVGSVAGLALITVAVAVPVARAKRQQRRLKVQQLALKPTLDIKAEDYDFAFLQESDITLGEELGAGSFGTVYRGQYKDRTVAIKVSQPGATEAMREFMKEAEVMMHVRPHPHVIQLFGICVAKGSVMVVLEFVEGGSLFSYLRKHSISDDESALKQFIGQMALGLRHCHRAKLIHRDFAARNILLSIDGQGTLSPKVADFGMARELEKNASAQHTQTTSGPVAWMSPESIGNLQYSAQSDIWSFGIAVWEIYTRQDPTQQMSLVDLAIQIRDRGFHPKIPNFIPPWLLQIFRGCWEKDPAKRITLDEIIKITGVQDYDIEDNGVLLEMRRRRRQAVRDRDPETELLLIKDELKAIEHRVKVMDQHNEVLSTELLRRGQAPPTLEHAAPPPKKKPKKKGK